MKLLRPTICVDSFANFPAQKLYEGMGLRGVTLDLDGALIEDHSTVVPPEHLDKLRELGELGMALALLTNTSRPERLKVVGNVIEGIEQETGLRVGLVSSYEAGYRKPHRAMFLAGAKALNLHPKLLCHFGDQLFKDVFGANLYGYGASVLCAPYGRPPSDQAVRYLQRPTEAAIRPFLGLPFIAADIGRHSP